MVSKKSVNNLCFVQGALLILVSILLLLGILSVAGCTGLLWGTPKAAFTWSPSVTYPHQDVEFDASASRSEKDEIIQYSWDFGDGETAIGVSIQHTFTSPGVRSVSLVITTKHGQEATVTHELTILDALVVPSGYSTIQAAIDAAQEGDRIVVLPGVYHENIDFLGKAITVQGTDPSDPDVVNATVIDGQDIDRSIVRFVNNETATSILSGLTIKGGHKYDAHAGGGIYVREASPTIRNNHIRDHSSFFAGGGIYLVESRARISDNVFVNNKSQSGGAIAVDGYAYVPTITGNTFSDNTAGEGGAIFIGSTYIGSEPAGAAPLILSDNTFTANAATLYGGGAVKVGYSGSLRLDTPDSNTYSNNDPDDIFYEVPPS